VLFRSGPRPRVGLLAVARDPSAPARAGAVWALGSVLRGHPDGEARKLFVQLARGGDLPLALSAVDALRASGDPTVAPELARLARGASRELRRAALEALGDLPDPKSEEILVAALDADDDALRAAAAWALAKRGGAAGQAELLRVVAGKGYGGAVNAAAALALRADKTGRAALEGLVGAGNPHVRANAIYGLSLLPTDAAIVALLERNARDPHKAVRAAAARALLRVKKGDAALAALAHDPDREVRRAAADAAPGAHDEDWLHVYVTDDEREPMRHALYVLTRPDGLVKAGYTDLRGELGEERIPPGTADLDLISSTDPAEKAP